MKKLNFEFQIIVKNKPINEYEHQGNIFVEGRKKSNFQVKFTNNSYSRVLAIPSVDGLNTLDGKLATPQSVGYVVNAKQTLNIPGWTLDPNNVAKFIFNDKEQSYAHFASPSGSSSAGVIGLLIFAEHIVYPTTQYPAYHLYAKTAFPSPTVNTVYPTMSQNSATTSVASTMRSVSDPVKGFSLGTGFGEQANFATRSISFDRGSQLAELIIYYDDKQGLSSRGIELRKKIKDDLPKAFSTSGCTPPPGWLG